MFRFAGRQVFCAALFAVTGCGGEVGQGRGLDAPLEGGPGAGSEAGSGAGIGSGKGSGSAPAKGPTTETGSSTVPGSPPISDDLAAKPSQPTDLLFVIDDSASMADKLPLIADAARRIASGVAASEKDVRVGVLSSTLWRGGQSEGPGQYASGHRRPETDRGARLLHVVGGAAFHDSGRLLDPAAAGAWVEITIRENGTQGSGYPSLLEVPYRFLSDPAPPLDTAFPVTPGVLYSVSGVDEAILAERAAFLRPGSRVVVVMLTDGNDVSTVDGNVLSPSGEPFPAYLPFLAALDGSLFRMRSGTEACAADPGSADCTSCFVSAAGPGCRTLSPEEDPLQLRFFDPRRRFGIDVRYPVSRYVQGFSSPTLQDGQPNALLSGRRTRGDIVFAVAGGVPWQDLANDPHDLGKGLRPAAGEGAIDWDYVLGSGAAPAGDPAMREATEPRTGGTVATGEIIGTAGSRTSVTGVELVGGLDYQSACSGPAHPESAIALPCEAADDARCRDGKRAYAVAAPATRPLALARSLGGRAIVGSICAERFGEPADAGYGLAPFAAHVVRGLARK